MRTALKLLAVASTAALVTIVSLSSSIGSNHVPLASAASDYFLKIEGIDGEIEVNSWSWSTTSLRDVATGQSSGKRQHKPFTIVKEWDRSSPVLFKASGDGTRYKKATLTRGSYTVTFFDVFVTGFQHEGEAGSPPTESVSFTYQKIEMK